MAVRDKLLGQAIVRLMAGDKEEYKKLVRMAQALDGQSKNLMASIGEILQAKGEIA